MNHRRVSLTRQGHTVAGRGWYTRKQAQGKWLPADEKMKDRKAEGANWRWQFQTGGKRDPRSSPYERTTLPRGAECFRSALTSITFRVVSQAWTRTGEERRHSYMVPRIRPSTQSSHGVVVTLPPSTVTKDAMIVIESWVQWPERLRFALAEFFPNEFWERMVPMKWHGDTTKTLSHRNLQCQTHQYQQNIEVNLRRTCLELRRAEDDREGVLDPSWRRHVVADGRNVPYPRCQ